MSGRGVPRTPEKAVLGRGIRRTGVAFSPASQEDVSTAVSSSPMMAGVRPPTGTEKRTKGVFDDTYSTYRVLQQYRHQPKTVNLASGFNKQGTAGKKVQLSTNYFTISADPSYVLAYYRVSFDPVQAERRDRREIMKNFAQLKEIGHFFDGDAALYAPYFIYDKKTMTESIQTVSGGSVKVTLILTQMIGDPTKRDDPFEMGRAESIYNNEIMGSILTKLGLIRVDNGYYNQKTKKEIKGLSYWAKIFMWPGYLPHITFYDKGLLLNVDLKSKFVFDQDKKMIDFIKKACPSGSPMYGPDHRQACVAAFKNMIVLTSYGDVHNAYQIMDVVERSTIKPLTRRVPTGRLGDSSTFTVEAYMKERYNIDIQDKNQLMLQCERASGNDGPRRPKGSRREDYYIPIFPELCWLTGLTPDVRTNLSNMNKLLDSVRHSPETRAKMTLEFATNVRADELARRALDGWGFSMNEGMEKVDARELSPIPLMQRQNTLTYSMSDADWTRNLRGNKLDNPANPAKWTMICSEALIGKGEELFMTLNKVGNPMGMIFAEPRVVTVEKEADLKYHEHLKAKINEHSNAELVVCVLPDNKKERYDGVKNYVTKDLGIPSQCILIKNLEQKRMMSVVTKLALQINAKMGGTLWHIKDPAVKLPGLMVVGAAISARRTAGGQKIYTLVSTVDSNYNRFTSKACAVEGKMGMSAEDFRKAFEDLLIDYEQANSGRRPQNIIFYRLMERADDLQDATDPQKGEMVELGKALRSMGVDAKVLFCVTLRRSSTRFFAQMGNPNAGTVVDSMITRPGRFDFYLVSHAGRKETSVMPTYYFVAEDQIGIPAGDFQNFSFQLCHMYYNWSGTIKIPAVCQYAFKMATMCGEVLKDTNQRTREGKHMTDKLWYL